MLYVMKFRTDIGCSNRKLKIINVLRHFNRYIAAAVAKSDCNATGLPKILPRNNLMALKYPSDFDLIEVPSLCASEVTGCGSLSLTEAIARHPLITSVTPQHRFKGGSRGLLHQVWSLRQSLHFACFTNN